MKTQYSKKLLGAMIVALLSAGPAYAVSQGQESECNSTDTLEGWGIWCGVDTFLAQQEPTAAGPMDRNGPELGSPAFNSDDFGGDLVEDSYNWRGYAIVRFENTPPDGQAAPVSMEYPRYSYKTGVFNILHNPDSNELSAVLVLEDGSTINFNQDATFIAPEWDTSYFRITSEDGSLVAVTFNGLPAARNNESVAAGSLLTRFDDDQSEPTMFWRLQPSKFVAGELTNVSVIDNLRLNNITASYSGLGQYRGDMTGIYRNRINVNFGNSSWAGTWYMGPGRLNAEGNVTGSTFSAGANDMNYDRHSCCGHYISYDAEAGSSINGSFNGPQAESLTGVVDVTVHGDRTVGVFANEMKDSWSGDQETE